MLFLIIDLLTIIAFARQGDPNLQTTSAHAGVRSDGGCAVQHQAKDTPLPEDTLERVTIEGKSDYAVGRLLHRMGQERVGATSDGEDAAG